MQWRGNSNTSEGISSDVKKEAASIRYVYVYIKIVLTIFSLSSLQPIPCM